MNLLFTIILGAVQGLSEFLPISSSGHLILFRDLLRFEGDYGLAVDAVLQLATTFAIIIYFRSDICRMVSNFLRPKETDGKIFKLQHIIVATIPIVIVGLLIEDYMDTIFRNASLVGYTLIAGSIIMILAEKTYISRSNLNFKNSFIVGIFQTLALIPGMSRSGMTISGGLFLGLNRELATRFSFIVAFPVLLGSGIKKVFDLQEAGYLSDHLLEISAGAITAFIVGFLAIHFLIRYLKSHSMNIFSYYRILLAIIILIFIA